ncbi:ribonuclease T2-like [Scheffersomyces spartinae]|uniref:Ribonuclease T2-like n=1 Tax=Scheffersomyces spartinae TaxID=45513 RepID=A0A9P7VDX1_9ASCO|nr:ribonuclease T2-like [Scheffersomyces spartinae]KAG7195882.1 ribonuclease T2-like [Scheffersomyces spartinae]
MTGSNSSSGGLLVQTQFWDYYPAVGDDNLFTVHGLWPDFCNGNYEVSCCNDLNITKDYDFESLFTKFDDYDSYQFMKRNWLNLKNNGPDLWVNEWNKHGTCVRTMRPKCYDKNDMKGRNLYEYFTKTLELFYQLPTYQWMVEAGIYPDAKNKYKLSEVEEALTKGYGKKPHISCNRHGAIKEVYYFHIVKGSVRDGEFERTDAIIYKPPKYECPDKVKWYPKGWTPNDI